MPNDSELIKKIFMEAIEKKPQERKAYVEDVCGTNAELKRNVEALLAAHDEGQTPPPARRETDATIGQGEDQGRENNTDFSLNVPESGKKATVPDDLIGAIIDEKYKILQRLGEGGMGTVYMAQRVKDIRTTVALKVIRLGMDSEQVLKRFEAERQALAWMDDSRIVKVLDAGTTERGRPYFVMEYVKGIPLTKYCDDYRLTIQQRLGIFVDICEAVQHAHQKGVVHRDLKPSNILVTLENDRPVPKIIDFGLVKALHHPLTDVSIFTGFGHAVGTWMYMAPEQAEHNHLDIDTRADIYSLGVILYELLTGSTPIERARCKQAAVLEVLRILKEESPPKPSTKLMSSAQLPKIAAQRRVEPIKLNKLIRGELDWIVMAALEKERTQRYQTANELAKDVQNYLNDEPVSKGPPTALYRVRKFVRKHRGKVAAVMVFVLCLVGGIIGTSWGMWRAKQAEKSALSSAQKAETINDFLINDLILPIDAKQRTRWHNIPYKDLHLRTLLERASNTVHERFNTEPQLEAHLHMTIGKAFRAIGEFEKGRQHFERAIALFSGQYGENDPTTLDSTFELALLLNEETKFDEAVKLLDLLMSKYKSAYGDKDARTLRTAFYLANSHEWLGQRELAENEYKRVLDMQEQALGSKNPDTLETKCALAGIYSDSNRLEEAEKVYAEVLRDRQEVLPAKHPDILTTINNMAMNYRLLFSSSKNVEYLKKAEGMYSDLLNSVEVVKGNEHPDYLVIANNLATVWYYRKEYQKADDLLKSVIPKADKVIGLDHDYRLSMVMNHGSVLMSLNHLPEAENRFREAYQRFASKYKSTHEDVQNALKLLISSLRKNGKQQEAEQLEKGLVPSK